MNTKKVNAITENTKEENVDDAAVDVCHPSYELIDPTPHLPSLFQEFNALFFEGRLSGCEVKWSKRMTLCAGVCSYQPASGFCSIRLSEPLLQLRPRSDLVNTLLHEMIHAFLFVTLRLRDREDHGPQFVSLMNDINLKGRCKVTVYHTFSDEVAHFRTHWWQCNGVCQHRSPYFGLVKRAMNRPPGARDTWWKQHQATCGGSYTKIREPKEFGAKQAGRAKRKGSRSLNDAKVSDYFKRLTNTNTNTNTNDTRKKDATSPSSSSSSSSSTLQKRKKRTKKLVKQTTSNQIINISSNDEDEENEKSTNDLCMEEEEEKSQESLMIDLISSSSDENT